MPYFGLCALFHGGNAGSNPAGDAKSIGLPAPSMVFSWPCFSPAVASAWDRIKEDTDSVGFGANLQRHVVVAACAREGRDADVHLGLREGRAGTLLQQRRERCGVDIRLSSQFDGGDLPAFIGWQHWLDLWRRLRSFARLLGGSGSVPVLRRLDRFHRLAQAENGTQQHYGGNATARQVAVARGMEHGGYASFVIAWRHRQCPVWELLREQAARQV